MADIHLTLPCPICPDTMLQAIFEPSRPSETPLLAEVSGCPHADLVMQDMSGASEGPPWPSLILWRALQHEAEQYCLDRYTDALEYRMDHTRSLREES
jgi:hypothetical protein